MGKDHFIIPIFVPHYGCPHDCVFCNQRRITGLSTDITPQYVRNTIESHSSTFPKGEITVEVAFYGGSFTGIEKEIQKELLAVPLEYKDRGIIDGIRLSTRPDYIDEDILNLLKEYKVDTIELGVQSLDDIVLNKSGRGHNSQQVYMASKLVKEYKFNLGLQMMVGLVGDSKEKAIYTAKEFVKIDPFCVGVYPTLVIRDTYLEKKYRNNTYKPLTLEKAIDITAHLLMIFEYYNIDVIRVGLQPTENLRLGKDVVAGPFHPSFRQLVESHIYKIILEKHLDRLTKVIVDENMIIEVNNKNVSNLVGQKSCNTRYLVNRYGLKTIKVYGRDMEKDTIGISIDGFNDRVYRKRTIEEYLQEKGIIRI